MDLTAFNGPGQGIEFGFGGYENASGGEFGSLLNFKNFTVLHVNVGAASAGAVTTLPARLAGNAGLSELTAARATQSRAITVTGGAPGGGRFTFNGAGYVMGTINQLVLRGATEAWTINAGGIFSHSFHIHGVQFKIVARNGNAGAVKDYEQGWKDTVYLPIRESLTFVARFDEPADASYPYMYHCHMSNHEDEGLMGQFTVK